MKAAAAHREDARAHALSRCRQRHGLHLSERGLAALEARLRDGEGELLRTGTDGRRRVRIRFLFDALTVVFCPALDCIVTVLTPEVRSQESGIRKG